jgi:hypothetical protein
VTLTPVAMAIPEEARPALHSAGRRTSIPR